MRQPQRSARSRKAVTAHGPEGAGEVQRTEEVAALEPPTYGVELVDRGGAAEAEPPEPLPPKLRDGLEALSGVDLAEVRVHRGSERAAELGAEAFTRGADIHLGPEGERHLAHEGWHAVQQARGEVGATDRIGDAAVNEDSALEAEADVMGAQAEELGEAPDEEVVPKPRLWHARSHAGGSDEPAQRRPGEPERGPGERVTSLGEGVHVVLHRGKRKGRVTFQGETWIELEWTAGFPPAVGVGRHDYDRIQAYLLTIESKGRMKVVLHRDVEEKVIATLRGRKVGVKYTFQFPGTIDGINLEGPGTFDGPIEFTVADEVPVIIIEGDDEPRRRVHVKDLELPDTFPSFDSLSKLDAHLRKDPKKNYAVLEMPDGRYVARELNEYQLRQFARDARAGEYRGRQTKYVERIESYEGRKAKGRFFKLSIEGEVTYAQSDLVNLYYPTQEAAERGTRNSAAECEVFRSGDYSFGRKPLTHDEAVARWKEFDRLSLKEINALETEPGRDFISLYVRGTGRIHSLGYSYFRGRETYAELSAKLAKTSDEDKREKILGKTNAGFLEDFLFIELDREQDNPEVIRNLKSQPDVARLVQKVLYQRVVEAARLEATTKLSKAAHQISLLVDDEQTLIGYVLGFRDLKAQDQHDSLVVLGVPEEKIPAYKRVLGNQRRANQLRYGIEDSGTSLEELREFGKKNAEGLEQASLKLSVLDEALQLEGEFGDNLRAVVYQQFGFTTLDPKKFPHEDRTSGAFPGPLSGKRSSFASVNEQIFAAHTKGIATIGTINKILAITALVAGAAVVIIAASLAGAVVAGIMKLSGIGALLVSSTVAGLILTGVEVGFEMGVLGKELTAGDITKKSIWNVLSFVGFGLLGKALETTSKGIQLSATLVAFLGVSIGHYRYVHKEFPKGKALASLLYQNLLMFALLHAGGVLTRPLHQKIELWARARRLGIKEKKIDDLLADVTRLAKDLSAVSVKPKQTKAEKEALRAREQELLDRKEQLLLELKASRRLGGDRRQFEKDFARELKLVREAKAELARAKRLTDLSLQRVGESHSLYEYKSLPEPAKQFQALFPKGRVVKGKGGRVEVYLPRQKEPLVFVPRGTGAEAAAVGAPKPKVNINTATREELMTLPGIKEAKADAIIAYREKNLDFATVDQLKRVPGIKEGTWRKLLPYITVKFTPKRPLAEVQAELAQRQDRILARAAAVDVRNSKSLDAIAKNRLRVRNTTNQKALDSARRKLDQAEKVVDRSFKQKTEKAIERYSERLGEDVVEAIGKNMFSREEIGSALYWANRYPGVGSGLSARALRGLVQIQRQGLSLKKFFSQASGKPKQEVDFVLETTSRMLEAQPPIRGVRRVIADMSASRRKWDGGLWALEKARYGHGLENVKHFELVAEGRHYDIVLKSGKKDELKNWNGWREDRGVAGLRAEFLQDVRLGGNRAEAFREHVYSFRDNPNLGKTVAQIRKEMRGWLKDYVAAEVKAGNLSRKDGNKLIEGFDSASGLIEISPVRYKGSVRKPPSEPVHVPAQPGPVESEKKRKSPRLPAPAP